MGVISFEFDQLRKNEAGAGKDLAESVSAITVLGDSIFVGGDEGVVLARLEERDSRRRFEERDAVDLRKWFDLPQPAPPADKKKVPEIDLEGLDIDRSAQQPMLWLLGSHSFKRGKAEPGVSSEKNLKALGRVSFDANRALLGCVPLIQKADRQWRLSEDGLAPGGARAAQVDPHPETNPLLSALRRDALLARYLAPDCEIAGKDNGLDFEGLAVAPGGRMLLGLRGPVLRGMAVVLELAPQRVSSAGTSDRLQLAPIGSASTPYRRHFLDLAGHGVRDLCWDGDDLLILAGPTMSLDAPPLIFRWREARLVTSTSAAETFQWRDDNLEAVDLFKMGFEWTDTEVGRDHAESIAFLDEKHETLIIAYDAPGRDRLASASRLFVDVVAWR